MRWTLVLLPLVVAGCVDRKAPTGAEDFATFCAACHGADGKGDGSAGAGLDPMPPDLTTLAARNGAVFPGTAAMAQIWGHTGGRRGDSAMPEFAPLLQGDLVPYDGGDGIMTPTPVRLVQLADYLKTLQN